MKPRVDEAIAAFIDELEAVPDQLMQQPAFKLRRQVKALHQVVSDLEAPVASVLPLNLECACPSVLEKACPLHADATPPRLFQMHRTLLAKAKVIPSASMTLLFSTNVQ